MTSGPLPVHKSGPGKWDENGSVLLAEWIHPREWWSPDPLFVVEPRWSLMSCCCLGQTKHPDFYVYICIYILVPSLLCYTRIAMNKCRYSVHKRCKVSVNSISQPCPHGHLWSSDSEKCSSMSEAFLAHAMNMTSRWRCCLLLVATEKYIQNKSRNPSELSWYQQNQLLILRTNVTNLPACIINHNYVFININFHTFTISPHHPVLWFQALCRMQSWWYR